MESSETKIEVIEDSKEFNIVLNTGEDAFIQAQTPNIKGVLKAIVLNSSQEGKIKIYLDKYPEIILYSCWVKGSKFIVPKVQPVASDGSYFVRQGELYTLNDIIIIEWDSGFDSELEAAFRWE